MSVPAKVKDFFVKKINAAINEKIEKAMSGIDMKEAKEKATNKALEDLGLAYQYSNFLFAEEQVAHYKAMMEASRSEIDRDMTAAGIANTGYYHSGVGRLRDYIDNQFFPKFIKENYPEISAEVERLKKTKDDAEAAVLLATTEAKLVERLASLLEKYGGDISDIKDMLPKE